MGEVWAALSAALRFDQMGIGRVGQLPALGVALIAAASTMLGHMAVLLLNRLRGLRLLTTLLFNLLGIVSLHAVQAAVTWGVASAILGRPVPLLPLVTLALVSVAPQAFAFITALPHFGMFFGRVLEGWSFLIWWLGAAHVFGLAPLPALGVTAAGWLTMQLLSRLLQRPINWVGSRLWTLATGQPTMVTSRDILAGMPVIPVTHSRAVQR